MDHEVDPRARRTRDAILGAFTALALNRRYDAIRTADLIAAAGVGRSTFYEHFRGKDEVLVAAVEPILHTLASAALGRASKAQVRAMLDHVWEQRAVARMLFEGRTGDRLQRRLAALIMARLEARGEVVITTRGVAAAQLTMLHLWLSGAVSCPVRALAEQLLAFRHLHRPPCSCESRSPE
jgi:AcrR family transcriptional regulator